MKRHSEYLAKLELDMKKGLGAGEFELYYQPLYGSNSGALRSFEALLRWNHPEKGLIKPCDFIPIAERSGFIIQLGQFVLNRACMAAANWPKPIGVSVNLSPIQFNEPNLIDHVRLALKRSGLPAGRLDLEITESSLLEPSPRTNHKFHDLKALGVRTTMDDFGTGFSSLNNLRNFSFDRLKIDRSFTSGVPENSQDMEIIRTILQLSKILKMETVIEGVETSRQLDFAKAENATEVQGYLFSKPLPLDEIGKFLPARKKEANTGIDAA
jgi:EAL domain-containing protein (putative c-di-GMP-specific phosphodiesterase class I)